MGLKGAGGRVEDKSEKGGEVAGKKNLPLRIEPLSDLCGVVSLCINRSRRGAREGYLSNVTPGGFMHVCVCICLRPCAEPQIFLCSPSSTPLPFASEQAGLGRLVPTFRARQWRCRHPPAALSVCLYGAGG